MKKVFSIFLLALFTFSFMCIPVAAVSSDLVPEYEKPPLSNAVVSDHLVEMEIAWNYTIGTWLPLFDENYRYIIVVKGPYKQVYILYSTTPWTLHQGSSQAKNYLSNTSEDLYGITFDSQDGAVNYLFNQNYNGSLSSFFRFETNKIHFSNTLSSESVLYSDYSFEIVDEEGKLVSAEEMRWPNKIPIVAFHAHKSLLLRVLKELLGLIPVIITPLLGFIALRKGVAVIYDIVHSI